jgi:transposase
MPKRRKVVTDAGPLMALAKLNILPLLKRLYGTVLISQTVYDEVVTEGLARGYPDARVVELFWEQQRWRPRAIKPEEIPQDLQHAEKLLKNPSRRHRACAIELNTSPCYQHTQTWEEETVMSATPYSSADLPAAQWTRLWALLPARPWRPGGPGRPPCELRQVLNGSVSLLTTGCQWRRVPREVGQWTTISAYFKCGRQTGVWATLMEALRQLERRRPGRRRPRRGVWRVSVSSRPPQRRRSAVTGASRSKAANAVGWGRRAGC